MDKSYEELVYKRAEHVAAKNEVDDAVFAAIDSLKRHNIRGLLCSRCDNDKKYLFTVTDIKTINDDSHSITEVRCNICKETSYVCHYRCYCQKNSEITTLERSYKEKMATDNVRLFSRSIHICSILESTVTVLRNNNESRVCLCGNGEPHETEVTGVDRLGFITSVKCRNPESNSETVPSFSQFEESYVVQLLHRGQPGLAQIIEQALNGDHVEHMYEVCNLLRSHSFYNAICPEYSNDDPESCRVTSIDKETGKVTEVEFVMPSYNQSLEITCRSECYYDKHPSSDYGNTYKEQYKRRAERKAATICCQTIRQTKETLPEKAILSCIVLDASAAMLRHRNTCHRNGDSALCPNPKCNNDKEENLKVQEVDKRGFITSVKCICGQFLSTVWCPRLYYEEINDVSRLRKGDQIFWRRIFGYSHHAIVTRNDDSGVTVAEYGKGEGHISVFRESVEDMSPSFCSGIAYHITYEDCYTDEYTVWRAEKCIGEKRYNLLNRNCEHQAVWCETGFSESDQVKSVFIHAAKAFLMFGLRIMNAIVLTAYHGSSDQKNQGFRECIYGEGIAYGIYMVITFLIFSVWSLYRECKKLKRADDDRTKTCFNRPRGAACGLFIRIVSRELCAVVPTYFAVVELYCNTYNTSWVNNYYAAFVVVILLCTISSYLIFLALGTVIGTLLEHPMKALCEVLPVCGEQKHDDVV